MFLKKGIRAGALFFQNFVQANHFSNRRSFFSTFFLGHQFLSSCLHSYIDASFLEQVPHFPQNFVFLNYSNKKKAEPHIQTCCSLSTDLSIFVSSLIKTFEPIRPANTYRLKAKSRKEIFI